MPVNRYPDELLEKVARLICEKLQIDPEAEISGDVLTGFTLAERGEYIKEYIKDSRGMPAVMVIVPQWRKYRQSAIDVLMQQELAHKLDALLKEHYDAIG